MATGPIYIDQALTSLSQAWTNDSGDFIAEKIFPVVEVDRKTGKYWAYNKDNLRVPSSTLRTGRSKTNEATFGRSLEDFGPLSEHALKDFISKDEYEFTDSPLNIETDVVNYLNEQMLLSEETDLAAILSDTTVITNNVTLSGTSQWSDAGSDPFTTITNGIKAMRTASLKVPNTLFMGWDVWMSLINNPALIERIKYSQTGVIGQNQLLALFAPYGITKIHVGKASANTAAEGQGDSLASVWGKHAWLGYVTDTPGLRQVNGGYTLRLRNGKYVDKWEERDPKGNYVRNNDYFDQMLFASEVFYFIRNAVA